MFSKTLVCLLWSHLAETPRGESCADGFLLRSVLHLLPGNQTRERWLCRSGEWSCSESSSAFLQLCEQCSELERAGSVPGLLSWCGFQRCCHRCVAMVAAVGDVSLPHLFFLTLAY